MSVRVVKTAEAIVSEFVRGKDGERLKEMVAEQPMDVVERCLKIFADGYKAAYKGLVERSRRFVRETQLEIYEARRAKEAGQPTEGRDEFLVTHVDADAYGRGLTIGKQKFEVVCCPAGRFLVPMEEYWAALGPFRVDPNRHQIHAERKAET